MPDPAHLFVVAGDPSGDRHAATLVTELKTKIPGLRLTALGGASLRRVVDHFLFDLVDLGGFGFWEPFLKLPALLRARKLAAHALNKDRPDAVILVDYYGFNIHVARAAKRLNIPVLYYISPQVWATRPHRILELKKVVRRMMVLFPFEKALYEKAGVPVTEVEHPLLKQLPRPNLTEVGPMTIGLLPGSRASVIARHLPTLAGTALRLHDQFPEARFIMIHPEELNLSLFFKFREQCPWVTLQSDADYTSRQRFSLAISVSGTAALELTLLGIPMILFYKLSPVTYALARFLIRIPYIGIPNILADRRVVPELVQERCTPESLALETAALIRNTTVRQEMKNTLLSLRERLRGNGHSAAEVIVSELSLRKVSL